MNNFDKIRKETATMEGMAKLFLSYDWEGKGKVFSKHAARYFYSEEEAIQSEIKWLQQQMEIQSCTPFQKNVILNDDNWSAEVEQGKTHTPILDKMLDIQKRSQLCEEFLEYLIDKYAMFYRKKETNPHYSGAGDYIDIKKVVEEYFTDPDEV